MVCLFVCLLVMVMSCVKTAEPIWMPFGELTRVGPRNYVLDRGQVRTNPFAAVMGEKMAM